MSASANSSNRPDLLSARNLILAAAAIFVLSILGMCARMLRTNDSGGMARDSYGTRAHGYRAVMEMLGELGVDSARELAPPQADADDQHTLALLGPAPDLVQYGPKYLQSLLPWVEGGGRIVVAPSLKEESLWDDEETEDKEEEDDGLPDSPRDILELLGLGDQLKLGTIYQAAEEGGSGEDQGGVWENVYERIPEEIRGYSSSLAGPPQELKARCKGTLSPLAADVRKLALPAEGFTALSAEAAKLAGSLSCVDEMDNQHLLVAVVRRGKGEIIVVSEPSLFCNRLISQADNSVLAAHLLAAKGEKVVFDEFYHNLSVRGNPLFLLTRPGFAAVAVGLLLCVGAWTWRSAVFLGPSLPEREPSRRDIREYVDAMGQFFCRGPGHRKFLVRELRDGVLRQLCRELRLPLDTPDVHVIATALRRHDPRRAERLEKVLPHVDAALAAPRDFPRDTFLPSLQGLVGCL